jgi:phosphoribosylaminoimidazolecarboxamide formyltransferase/IMP cyclohydrolase
LRAAPGSAQPGFLLHRIGGGLLWQETDPGVSDGSDWKTVTRAALQPSWIEELRFAMHAASVLRSNAIAVTRDGALIGAGAGQPSRIEAARIALNKAADKARGAFLASDAFFPFPDCVEAAAAAGVLAIVQPGGSLRDGESIAACDRHGIAMVFTGRRHFRH